MIACCSDGTRPVIVKLERLDYCAAYLEGNRSREDDLRIAAALKEIPSVQEIIFREHYAESTSSTTFRKKPSGRQSKAAEPIAL